MGHDDSILSHSYWKGTDEILVKGWIVGGDEKFGYITVHITILVA